MEKNGGKGRPVFMTLNRYCRYKFFVIFGEEVCIEYDIPNKDSSLILVPVVGIPR